MTPPHTVHHTPEHEGQGALHEPGAVSQTPTMSARYPSLRDKRIIVTGGASGIGEAIVEASALQGAQGEGITSPSARVTFSGIEGGLHSWSSAEAIGFELCDAGGTCRFAPATADGDAVVIKGDASAARVRYARADSPVVNLFDGRSLPVPGFELPVAP